MDKLVSVLIPIYSFNNYCKESIVSIVNQTFEKLEIILIDDSYDSSLLNYTNSLNDERIVLIKGNRKGLSNALNLGVKYANGNYIARMDSDDISKFNRIEKQYFYLLENNLDLCFSNASVFGSHNHNVVFPEFHKDINFLLNIMCPLIHPTLFIKAEILKKNKYSEKINAAEDYDLWVRLISQDFKFGNIQEFLIDYREHHSQASKLNIHQNNVSIKIAKQHSCNYLDPKNFNNMALLKNGFDKSYDFSEVLCILNILLSEIKQKKLNVNLIKRYTVSLFLRIMEKSINIPIGYLRYCFKNKIKIDFKLFLYLIFKILFGDYKLEKFHFIKKIY